MSNEQKITKTGPAFSQRLVMLACTGLVIGAILIGICWGSYRLALANTSHSSAVIWALGATALVPVVGYACYHLGQIEGRGVMNGLAAGVGAVMGAANQVADVKMSTTRAMRPVAPVYQAALPEQVVIDIEPHHEEGTVYV